MLISFLSLLFTSVLFIPTTASKLVVTKADSLSFYIDNTFPSYQQFSTFFSQTLGESQTISQTQANISISTTVSLDPQKNEKLLSSKLFVLVKDFKNSQSNISTPDLQYLETKKTNIRVTDDIHQYFPLLDVTVTPLKFVDDNTNNFVLMPFDSLSNQFKVISIDSNTPLDKNFQITNYPLAINYYIHYPKTIASPQLDSFLQTTSNTSWDASNLHSVILTGTTALGRGEYFYIKRNTVDYPNQYVASILKNADITQVSDEVSYDQTCTQEVGTMKFCALPSFINTLKDAGVNVVELTGNHNNDFGAEYSKLSLDMYHAANMKTFGGGYTSDDAKKPAIITLRNNTFCFLGYNQPGPTYAFATQDQSGAAKLNPETFQSDIESTKKQCDFLFVDVQWQNENNETPDDSQVTLSREAIDAGADVVTGTSGHRPEGMEFYKGKTIMYGLGNLFFDQMENLDTRQNVIVKHIFYKNNLIGTQFIPTLLYNYSQPRPATGSDATDILAQIWNVSPSVF